MGKKWTAAQKAKLSAEMKGKRRPHRGHPESAATRAKISAALKARDAARKRETAAERAKAKAERAAVRLKAKAARVALKAARKTAKAHRIRVLRDGRRAPLTAAQRQNRAELGYRPKRRVGSRIGNSSPRSRRIKRIRHHMK